MTYKREVEIKDATLKKLVTPEQIIEADTFMTHGVLSDPRVEVGDEKITKQLTLIHKDYLCYIVARDEVMCNKMKHRFGDMWVKRENYKGMYEVRLRTLEDMLKEGGGE